MKLVFHEEKRIFLFSCNYFERKIPQKAGFKYSSKADLWHTGSITKAIKLYEYAGEELQERFDRYKEKKKEKIEKSLCVTSDFQPPKPDGLEYDYFDFQRAGIEYAKDRQYTLIADEMGCIDGEALIAINRGGNSKEIKLKDIYKRTQGIDRENWNWDMSIPTMVRSLCDDGYFRLREMTGVYYKGYKECLEIKLNNNKKLSLTPDHLVKTDKGWERIDSLSIGDEIYTNGTPSCKRCGSIKKVSTYKNFSHLKYCKSKITSIKDVGKKDVYDLTVEDTHNFVANNVCVHNCGKSIQTVGVINCLEDFNNIMIICPNSMKGVWRNELHTWCTHTGKKISINNSAEFTPADIMIINYEAFRFSINPKSKNFRDPKKGKYNSTLELWKDLKKLDGIDLLVLDECFTPDTEILTEDGFVRFDKLEHTKRVAQFDNGDISFVQPTAYIEKEYKGKLVHLYRERGIDLKMTPHHEMIMWNRRMNYYEKKECDSISFNSNYHFPVAGKNINGNSELTPYEKLIIAIQADGSIHNTSLTSYDFQFSKKRKVDKFISLMEDGAFIFNEVKGYEGGGNKKPQRRFIVTDIPPTTKNIYDYFKIDEINYIKARNIIEEMIHWDGHIYSKNKYYFSSVDEKCVDFYQTIATIAGYKTHKSKQVDNRKDSFNDVYRLYISKNLDYTGLQDVSKKYINYEGKIYCVRVPKENIIVRRNGKVIVTGNSHRIKNWQANTTRNIFKLKSRIGVDQAIFLTGTPIFSRPDEIWTTIKFFEYEDKFRGTKADFMKYYQNSYFDRRYKRTIMGEPQHLDELQSLLRSYFMIRRTKSQVFDDMPEKLRKIVPVEVDQSKFEHFQHLTQKIHDISALSSDDMEQSILSSLSIQDIREYSELRMLAGEEKVPAVIEYVKSLVDAGEKVIIFGHHRAVLNEYKKAFPNCGFITGSTPSEDRADIVDRFQNDPECMVFIGNMISAGVGLTLTASSNVVFAELDPVPANMRQAEDRAHRISQTETVIAHYIVADKTLDAYLADMIIGKQNIFDRMIEKEHLNG